MTGFRAPRHYGFELVDAEQVTAAATIPRQSKIYSESNQSDFSRFFGELSPLQSLAIYRQTLGVKRWRIFRRTLHGTSGIDDVFSAAHGFLARAGARAVAEGKDA
jgi:hypothetical protein